MKSKQIPIRHGDVCFHPVDKTEGKPIKHSSTYIVGYGSTTGHTHKLSVKNLKDLVITQTPKGEIYFELKVDGSLTHDEHKTIKLPKGMYKKFQEEEVDHFAKSVTRKVLD